MKDTATTSITDLTEKIHSLLAEHERTGTSLARLARNSGIAVHRLYYIHRKRAAESCIDAGAAFAPVRIVGPVPSTTGLELCLGNNLLLRIPRGADLGQVVSLVANRIRTSDRYTHGSAPASLQLSMSVYMVAAASPPRRLPAKSQLRRPTATGRMARSQRLLSRGTRPSSRAVRSALRLWRRYCYEAFKQFQRHYNDAWLVARHHYQLSSQIRASLTAKVV